MALMGIAKFERFFRLAAGLDVDKSDLRRYSDFVNGKIYDLLLRGQYSLLPWHMLTYDTRLGGYVVDLDRDKLENAPSYASTESPNWSDRSFTDRIDQYWRNHRTAGLASDETWIPK